MERFQLLIRDGEGDRTIEVHGELDLAVAGELRDAIGAAAGARVSVDLSHCDFIDSTAIATILIGRRELSAEGGDLVLTRASDQVLRLLRLVGLDGDGLLLQGGNESGVG